MVRCACVGWTDGETSPFLRAQPKVASQEPLRVKCEA